MQPKKCDNIITSAGSGLFKFRCNIFIGVRIIKEMPGSVAGGTHCTRIHDLYTKGNQVIISQLPNWTVSSLADKSHW